MHIINEIQLDFDDVLIQPKRSTLNSRKEVDLHRNFSWTSNGSSQSFTSIPIMSAPMGTVGTIKIAEEMAMHDMMCALEKHIPVSDIISLFKRLEEKARANNLYPNYYTSKVFLTIGIRESLDALVEVSKHVHITGIDCDVPNAYCPKFIERVKEIRELFPDAFIIAGVVATGDMAQDLINAGANCIAVGLGNGSVCLTRLKTGVGRPNLSALIEVADVCHQQKAYCLCNGGCNNAGDVCKAFCAGADFVMSGSLFAGTDEAEGDIVEKNGQKFKAYYGMSSKLAQEKHFGGFENHRASEGREKLIPYTGSLNDVVEDILGGLRSCCTYIGSNCIKHMNKHCTFYRVNHQLNTKFADCRNI